MMPPPVNIEPHHKAYVDMLADAEQRKRSRHSWIVWLSLLGISLACLYAFNHGFITGAVGTAVAIVGIVGVFLFLAFLSTKAYGFAASSFRWWWMR
jgi:phosphate/sulfate permease